MTKSKFMCPRIGSNTETLSERNKLLAWLVVPSVALTLLFLTDLFFIKETLLTSYNEYHQCSPSYTSTSGVSYRIDSITGAAYTIGSKGKLCFYDITTGKIREMKLASTTILPYQNGVVVRYDPINPFYAFFKPALSVKLFVVLIVICLYLIIIFRMRNHLTKNAAASVVLLTTSAIVIRAIFAWLRHGFSQMGAEFLVYPNEDIIFDVPRIDSIVSFVRDYPQQIQSLSLHGSHFPPGYAVFLKLVALAAGHSNMDDIVGCIGLYGWVVIVLGSTAVIPLYLLVREIAGIEKAYLAAALFVVLPNSIIFGAVSMDAVFAAISLWPIYFFVRAHGRAPVPNALAAGFLLGITLFFSFSGFVVGLLLLIMSVIQAVRSRELFNRYVIICACIGLGFLVNIALPYVFLGYNSYETFIVARSSAQSLMQNVVLEISGKTQGQLYLYTIWGNVLAFLIYSGLPIVGIWWRRMFVSSNEKMSSYPERDLARATAALVAILACAGFYHMETERIWLFISGLIPATIIGCINNEEHGSFSGRLAVIVFSGCALQALILETLFFTIW